MDVFQKYLQLCIEASMVILVILAVRPLFKRFSNRIACLLWGVVLLRLLCPYTIQRPAIIFPNHEGTAQLSELGNAKISDEKNANKENKENKKGLNIEYPVVTESVAGGISSHIGNTQKEDYQAEAGKENAVYSKGAESHDEKNEIVKSDTTGENTKSVDDSQNSYADMRSRLSEEKEKQEMVKTAGVSTLERIRTASTSMSRQIQIWIKSEAGNFALTVCGITWILGMVSFLLYGTFRYFKTLSKLSESVPLKMWRKYQVRTSDMMGVPISFGILQQKIYVPDSFRADYKANALLKRQHDMILRHEEMHLRHHDPLWKVIAFLALSVHWWNPLVWIAVRCLNQDIEMACDERVLEVIGQEKKKEYATTLLDFAMKQSRISLVAAFGESHAERRIRNVVRYQKAPMWLSVILLGGALLLGGCLATKASDHAEDDAESANTALQFNTNEEGKDSQNVNSTVSNPKADSLVDLKPVTVLDLNGQENANINFALPNMNTKYHAQYKDAVYYRRFTAEDIREDENILSGALGIGMQFLSGTHDIWRINQDGSTEIYIKDDPGMAELYVAAGKLFSTYQLSGEKKRVLYYYDLETKRKTEIAQYGLIYGVYGDYIFVEKDNTAGKWGEEKHSCILDARSLTEVVEFSGEYLGADKDGVYSYVTENASFSAEKFNVAVYRTGYAGEEVLLSRIDKQFLLENNLAEKSYPDAEPSLVYKDCNFEEDGGFGFTCFQALNDKIVLNAGSYGGSGRFYQGGFLYAIDKSGRKETFVAKTLDDTFYCTELNGDVCINIIDYDMDYGKDNEPQCYIIEGKKNTITYNDQHRQKCDVPFEVSAEMASQTDLQEGDIAVYADASGQLVRLISADCIKKSKQEVVGDENNYELIEHVEYAGGYLFYTVCEMEPNESTYWCRHINTVEYVKNLRTGEVKQLYDYSE